MQARQHPKVTEHIAKDGVLVVSGSLHIQLGGRNLMKLRAIVGLTREAAGDKTFDLAMSNFDRPATWIVETAFEALLFARSSSLRVWQNPLDLHEGATGRLYHCWRYLAMLNAWCPCFVQSGDTLLLQAIERFACLILAACIP